MTNLLDVLGWMVSRLGFQGVWLSSRLLAWVLFDVFRFRRNLVLENVSRAHHQQAFEGSLTSIARDSYAHFICMSLEFLGSKYLFPKLSITVQNLKYLDEAVAGGGGTVAFSQHLSNIEVMASYGLQSKRPGFAVVKPVGGKTINNWVTNRRAQNGYQVIKRGLPGEGFKHIFEKLQENSIIGFMVDQYRKKGVLVPFFGQKALTSYSLLQILEGSPNTSLLQISIFRSGLGKYVVTFEPPLQLPSPINLTTGQGVVAALSIINQSVEAKIREHPEQYFWLHNRWKKGSS